jgi:hypothetical protein
MKAPALVPTAEREEKLLCPPAPDRVAFVLRRPPTADRRPARQARKRLAAELAAYSSPADRLELDLILGRHSAEETAEVDAVLNRLAASAA